MMEQLKYMGFGTQTIHAGAQKTPSGHCRHRFINLQHSYLKTRPRAEPVLPARTPDSFIPAWAIRRTAW